MILLLWYRSILASQEQEQTFLHFKNKNISRAALKVQHCRVSFVLSLPRGQGRCFGMPIFRRNRECSHIIHIISTTGRLVARGDSASHSVKLTCASRLETPVRFGDLDAQLPG